MNAFEILVLVLSIMLAIFLLLAIVLTGLTIGLVKKVNRVADKAEETAQNIVDASDKFKQFAGPAAIVQMVAKIISRK